MKFNQNITLTTPIFYANGPLHLGHAYTGIFTDTIARILKLYGHNVWVTFGADEHGSKIVNTAEKLNISPQELIDDMFANTTKLWEQLNVDYDVFTRTSDLAHKSNVLDIYDYFQKQNLIYFDSYNDFYCVHCEEFFTTKQVGINKKCPSCERDVKKHCENSYFFNVRKFKQWIINFYQDHPDFCQPQNKITEILNNFLNADLVDLSLTRQNLDWGVKFVDTNKNNFTLYVWFDALFNYLTACNFDANKITNEFKEKWENATVINIIGKEITRFHCLYFPIFLHALDLKISDKIFVHQWILNAKEKMSKSKHNFVYCQDILKEYPVDALRYYVIKTFPYLTDHHYSSNELKSIYNADLVNEIGNLISRLHKMISLYCNCTIPFYQLEFLQSPLVNKTNLALKALHKKLYACVESLNITNYLQEILLLVKNANKIITDSEPWTLYKNNDQGSINNILGFLTEIVGHVLIYLSPIMPTVIPSFYKSLFGKSINITALTTDNNYASIKISAINKLFMRK